MSYRRANIINGLQDWLVIVHSYSKPQCKVVVK